MEILTSWLNHISKAPLPETIMFGWDSQHMSIEAKARCRKCVPSPCWITYSKIGSPLKRATTSPCPSKSLRSRLFPWSFLKGMALQLMSGKGANKLVPASRQIQGVCHHWSLQQSCWWGCPVIQRGSHHHQSAVVTKLCSGLCREIMRKTKSGSLVPSIAKWRTLRHCAMHSSQPQHWHLLTPCT